jgi:hypothetical protein
VPLLPLAELGFSDPALEFLNCQRLAVLGGEDLAAEAAEDGDESLASSV